VVLLPKSIGEEEIPFSRMEPKANAAKTTAAQQP
jgi:hypothetical protein